MVYRCALLQNQAAICSADFVMLYSGTMQITALEYRHIRDLAVHMPAGAKVHHAWLFSNLSSTSHKSS